MTVADFLNVYLLRSLQMSLNDWLRINVIKVPLTMVIGKNLNPLCFDSINWAPYVGFLSEQMLHRSVFIAGGQVCCPYLGASYPLHTFENSVQLFLILQKVCQTMCCNSDDEDVETRCFENCKKISKLWISFWTIKLTCPQSLDKESRYLLMSRGCCYQKIWI